MKKIWVFILFLFVSFSVNADAQLTSLSQLPPRKRAISLGYMNFYNDFRARFDVEHSFTDRTKAAFITELGFYLSAAGYFDRLSISSFYQVVHVKPLWTTSLDSFFVGALGFHGAVQAPPTTASGQATFDQSLQSFSVRRVGGGLLNQVSVSVGGGLLLKMMGPFKPFVGVTYNYYIPISETYNNFVAISEGYSEGYREDGFFAIIPGFDFDIFSRIGVFGQVSIEYEPGYGFRNTGIVFIGLRFH